MTPLFPYVPPAGHEVREKGEITRVTLTLTGLLLLGTEQVRVIYDSC